MTDFFDKMDDEKLQAALHSSEEVVPEIKQEETKEPSNEIQKIKIGEEEYDPQELSKLVELGKIGRQAESEYNTDLKSVWPEFGKTKNREKELEAENLKLKEQTRGIVDTEERTEALKLASEMGILTKENLKSMLAEAGYMSTDEFRQQYVIQRETDKLLDTCQDLEEKIKGEDGRPAFKKQEVLEYMAINPQFRDPELAYKSLHADKLISWTQEKLSQHKAPGLTTEETGVGFRTPEPVRTTKENLLAQVSEALNGGSD